MAVALITGASRGFGRALARSLALDGWSLVLDARGGPALEAVATELVEHTPNRAGGVRAVPGDVTDPWHRERARRRGRGARRPRPAREQRERARTVAAARARRRTRSTCCASVYDVNVLAPLALAQIALPLLRRSHGTIVNITSDAGARAVRGLGRLRLVEGCARAGRQHPRRRGTRRARVHVRSRRHAHADAPGSVPGRGHLRSPRTGGRSCRRSAGCSGSAPGEWPLLGAAELGPMTVQELDGAGGDGAGRSARHHARRGPDDGRLPTRPARRARPRARPAAVPRRGRPRRGQHIGHARRRCRRARRRRHAARRAPLAAAARRACGSSSCAGPTAAQPSRGATQPPGTTLRLVGGGDDHPRDTLRRRRSGCGSRPSTCRCRC